jgi:hypothetical protein
MFASRNMSSLVIAIALTEFKVRAEFLGKKLNTDKLLLIYDFYNDLIRFIADCFRPAILLLSKSFFGSGYVS